jgi:hypothetical protein
MYTKCLPDVQLPLSLQLFGHKKLEIYSKTVCDPFDDFIVQSDSFLLTSVMMKIIMVPTVSGRKVMSPTNLAIK